MSASYSVGGDQPHLGQAIDAAADELLQGYVKLLLKVDQGLG